VDEPELRPAYRTLDEPTRLFGIALSGWAALLLASGLGYAWLLLSPLGWRVSLSVAVVVLGGPACLLALREQSTVGPGRLLLGVLRWRLRPAAVVGPTDACRVSRGGVRLDEAAAAEPVTASGKRPRAWPECT
jgi:hypothetical protein